MSTQYFLQYVRIFKHSGLWHLPSYSSGWMRKHAFMSIFVIGHQRIILTGVLPIATAGQHWPWKFNMFQLWWHFCPFTLTYASLRQVALSYAEPCRLHVLTGVLRPLTDARSINPAIVVFIISLQKQIAEAKLFVVGFKHCDPTTGYQVLTSGDTVETLYSTIYYSKYFIELNLKSAQYIALWTHKRHPIPRPFGRAMECLLWVLQQKLTVL